MLSAWYETTMISHGFRSARTNIRLISAINTLEVVISWRELKQNNRYWYSDEAGSITIYFFTRFCIWHQRFLRVGRKSLNIAQGFKTRDKGLTGLASLGFKGGGDGEVSWFAKGMEQQWNNLPQVLPDRSHFSISSSGNDFMEGFRYFSWDISGVVLSLSFIVLLFIVIYCYYYLFLGYIWCVTVIIIYCRSFLNTFL